MNRGNISPRPEWALSYADASAPQVPGAGSLRSATALMPALGVPGPDTFLPSTMTPTWFLPVLAA